ncbi:MAG: DMT family transporter [Lachnospiraceae bacterium]|nr:DMT family transporter [Lachnospiraceae bacterium]
MSKKGTVSSVLLLFLAALIWGFSFVAQSDGGLAFGAFSFNGARLLFTALILRILITITDKMGISSAPVDVADKKRQLFAGLVCGLFIFVATNFQQIGMNLGAGTGKAGFITSMYILMVPIIGLFFRQKIKWNVWAAVGVALVGLYFLCVNGKLEFVPADICLMLGALGFAGQIVTIDRYGNRVDALRLSGMQFLFGGFLTSIIAVIYEVIPFPGGIAAWAVPLFHGRIWLELLYMAVLSGGVAYSLQIICQKRLNPTVASLIMSFEAVFSAFAGWLILHQKLSQREIIGCFIMFAAVIIAQINFKHKSS